MDQRERYRSTPPPRTLDDMPLAAYGGTGMEDDGVSEPDAEPSATPAASPAGLDAEGTMRAAAATPSPTDTMLPPAGAPDGDAGTSARMSPLAGLAGRVVRLFRTSRLAAGAGFAVVIVVGLILLSGGGSSPAATAATPTQPPSAAPTIPPPSGDAALTLSGAATGQLALTGLAGGQHVDATSVAGAWGDGAQTTLTIAGPLDRGTRATDEHLVLTLTVPVAGQPVTFTSAAGECTIGMAQVGAKVQGSFTCHKLASADGKLVVEASGTYRT